MSTVTDSVCNLLDEQKELMLRYEQATLALLECEPDGAEHYIIERDKIATEVDALTERIGRLCADEPGGALLLETARGRADFNRVPGEFQPVFYAAQALQSVVARVIQSNRQATERLEGLRDEAMEAIRQNQNLPKIRRYLTGLTGPEEGISLHEGKA